MVNIKYLLIYSVSHIPGGAGFLPSTVAPENRVSQNESHQPSIFRSYVRFRGGVPIVEVWDESIHRWASDDEWWYCHTAESGKPAPGELWLSYSMAKLLPETNNVNTKG